MRNSPWIQSSNGIWGGSHRAVPGEEGALHWNGDTRLSFVSSQPFSVIQTETATRATVWTVVAFSLTLWYKY